MKLPKQWKHWCRKYGLKPRYDSCTGSKGLNDWWTVETRNERLVLRAFAYDHVAYVRLYDYTNWTAPRDLPMPSCEMEFFSLLI